ncbi:MAG TPA: SIS domain-containing protein [Terracidiphilus sp.]|jgi:tagatose-6-phosphate ketose/aldose isomerase|nr:SIS domain-containing protein [Terracidiphilus sp.]
MQQDLNVAAAGRLTAEEIARQPELWPIVGKAFRSEVERLQLEQKLRNKKVLITGAGSSAYAASAVAGAWRGAMAVPTTDLLLDTERSLTDIDAVISLARSGESPESAAVVERIRALRPEIRQIAIVCNPDSALSRAEVDELIALDPRTNDRSLVMTSSFSSLVLAGTILAQPDAVLARLEAQSAHAAALLPEIDLACRHMAGRVHDRIVVLSSSPLLGWAREAGLKMLEMTAGHFSVETETFLGLRHGPMSFVKPDTFVLCLLSSDPVRRSYELDLVDELRSKKIGYLVGITDGDESDSLFDERISAIAPHEDDALRTTYEIVGPQLLGFHLSLRIGLNPDNPSPDGIINRVVSGVKIHS